MAPLYFQEEEILACKVKEFSVHYYKRVKAF